MAASLAISRAEAKVKMKTLFPIAGLIFALMHFSLAVSSLASQPYFSAYAHARAPTFARACAYAEKYGWLARLGLVAEVSVLATERNDRQPAADCCLFPWRAQVQNHNTIPACT